MAKQISKKSADSHKERTDPRIPWHSVKQTLRATRTGKTETLWPSKSGNRRYRILAKDPIHYFPGPEIFKRVHSYAYQMGNELDRALFDGTDLCVAWVYLNARAKKSKKGLDVPADLFGVWRDANVRFRYQGGLPLTSDLVLCLTELTDDGDAAFLGLDELAENPDGCYDTDDIDAWLKRYGFRPTLLPEDVGIPHAPMIEALLRTASFSKAVARANYLSRDSITKIAAKTSVYKVWLRELIVGESVAVDLEALERVATYFRVDADLFVRQAVRAIHRRG